MIALLLLLLLPLQAFLVEGPWFTTLGGLVLIAFVVSGLRPAITTFLMLALIGFMGVWALAMDTLSQVVVATLLAVILGFGLGGADDGTIAGAGLDPGLEAALGQLPRPDADGEDAQHRTQQRPALDQHMLLLLDRLEELALVEGQLEHGGEAGRQDVEAGSAASARDCQHGRRGGLGQDCAEALGEGEIALTVEQRAVVGLRNADIGHQLRARFLDHRPMEMTMREAVEYYNDIVDESDPDMDSEPQITHAIQCAIGAKESGLPEWAICVGFIHDVGKLLVKLGLKQAFVVGDEWPVGCAPAKQIVCSQFFSENPDTASSACCSAAASSS